MKKIVPFLWTISFLLLFTSCSAAIRTPVAMNSPAGSAAPNEEYQIQVGDALDIKLFYHPELNESVIVRPDGRISLQLVHEVQASGLTPEQLRRQLRDKYAPQISQPEIAVIVRSFAAQKVYVDGEVAKPGLIPLTGKMTVLQSIASAGGLKDTARVNEVIVVRRGPDNRPASMLVNVEKAIDGSDPTQDLALQPADIVYVPKSPIANVNLWVDQYIRKNIPIPFGFSYNLAPY
jgi:protein involved in polysaccharide export with SLBB domain